MTEDEVDGLVQRARGLKALYIDEFLIKVGAAYRYKSPIPYGCKGRKYRVNRFCLAVPVYQIQVLVESLEGKDEGLSFVCSPANFVNRYEPIEERKE